MAFFIDTNIFIASLRGRAPEVQAKFVQHPPQDIFVPCQVVAELRLGAAKSARPEHNDRQVSHILQPFSIVWPDLTAIAHYVDIRAGLERSGNIIGEADLWIAAITRAAAGTLVTHNTDEFARVPGLNIEDWLKN
ncbi:MAG: type II toxin-antitoxin system VapC family toxin [Prosthecobacter sp.]|nr:type II toxin-antitoxin system VapC family toxin [Prosthecobacter sp.]